MNWVYTMNVIAAGALFLPIAAIVFSKISFHRTFPILLVYYSFAFIYNLMTLNFEKFDLHVINNTAVANNLLDGPLMLGFLTYLCFTKSQLKMMRGLIAGLLILTVIIVFFTGFNDDAVRIMLGPAVSAIFLFSCKFLSHYSNIIVRRPSSTGKTLMAAALISGYGTYAIIYVLYYVVKIKAVDDTFLVYFLATIVSASCMAIGIYYEGKKIKRIKEVQRMRKELAELYADEANSSSKRNKLLDDLLGFDPSQVVPGFRN